MNKGQMTLISLAVALIGIGLSLPYSNIDAAQKNLTKTIEIQLPAQTETKPESVTYKITQPQLSWKKFKVKKGDSLALIFRRAGEKATTLHNIMSSGEVTTRLKHLRVGQIIEFG